MLVSEIATGASLFVAAFAVTLTAVRLMPLAVTLMPLLRGDATPEVEVVYFVPLYGDYRVGGIDAQPASHAAPRPYPVLRRFLLDIVFPPIFLPSSSGIL